MEDLQRIIRAHPFFAGLSDAFSELIGGCARNVVFAEGDHLFRQGEEADALYLLRSGQVALEITAPGRGTMTFLTLGPGDVVGVSWLVPPYRWSYDARVVEPTRAIAMDAHCLRRKCEDDPALGYELMKRFVPVLSQRLQAARLQMLDVYGPDG
ncbi:cyclic nucleotide-binding domain-containing protein [Jhaorihella thermophila]|uniref:Cyclic nucleotide-binding domain-containing protein n=1 Tax=Jhaorihella thermophila TaxID=488547 RepID=A0A1H5UI22_9RHOB|nr:cyclic nucleotide-binding domain-containing protein [Jhaorihella thermophila]SEF74680.1 Cyclic nucleotide-binding domain-containing protein [Jhaorihella thermophila]